LNVRNYVVDFRGFFFMPLWTNFDEFSGRKTDRIQTYFGRRTSIETIMVQYKITRQLL
jgi:hypothetical protein